MRSSWKSRRILCTNIQKKLFLSKKGNAMTFLLVNNSEGILLKPKSQTWSWHWYVVMIIAKGTQTALFIGNRSVENCEQRFRRLEGKNSRALIGFSTFPKEATQTWFHYCKNARDVLLYIRAFQGHTGGNVVSLELMGHVAIPYNWGKNACFIEDARMIVTTILKTGLIAGGRENKEDRPSSSHLGPFGNNPDEEEPSDDLLKPRRVHDHSKRKPRQDKGWRLWQARSNAAIVYNSVTDCIYKVISFKGERTFIRETLDASACTEDSTHAIGEEKRTEVLQQTTQNHRASRNRCDLLSHLLGKKFLDFKSTADVKDLHQM